MANVLGVKPELEATGLTMHGEKSSKSAGRPAPIDAATVQQFRCVGIAQGCANHGNADKVAFILSILFFVGSADRSKAEKQS
jgi:hypothetical protein